MAAQLQGIALLHDVRLWLLASVMGCLGLRRGGEFLASPGRKQKRPVSWPRHEGDWVYGFVRRFGSPGSQTKSEVLSLFLSLPGTCLDIVRSYVAVHIAHSGPALILASGQVLSKVWMFKRAERLLKAANMVFFGQPQVPRTYLEEAMGRRLRVGAKSWRCGGNWRRAERAMWRQLF